MLSRIAVAVVCVATVAAAMEVISEAEYEGAFTTFMTKFGKTYSHKDFLLRYQTFKDNYRFVKEHNKRAAVEKTFTVRINEFADLTNKEFAKIYHGTHITKPARKSEVVPGLTPEMVHALPATVDWRTKGAVTAVKNQGQCGSCWSFSATGSMEGQHYLSKQGPLVGLSEQNLVDCSDAQGNQGCDGGLMDQAFQYVIQNKGIDSEASYPYQAVDQNCQFNAKNVATTINSYQDVPSGNETALQYFVATVGPISVAIDASQSSFQLYDGGVYYSYLCSSSQLDHGVLAVGYGTYQGTDYWLVKNSWGASWGLNGYIMMIRNWENDCGIATAASFPIIKST